MTFIYIEAYDVSEMLLLVFISGECMGRASLWWGSIGLFTFTVSLYISGSFSFFTLTIPT